MTTPDNAAKVTLVLGGARSGKSNLAEKLAHSRAGSDRGVLYVATLQAQDDEMRERVVNHRSARPPRWRTVEAPYDLAGTVLPALHHEQVVLVDCLTIWSGNLILRESANTPDVLEAQGAYGEIYDDEIAMLPPRRRSGSSDLEPDREEVITSDLQDEIGATAPSAPSAPAAYRSNYKQLEATALADLEDLVGQLRARDIGLIMVSNEVGMGLVPPYPLGRLYRDMLGRLNQRLAALSDEVYMVFAGLPLELKRLQAELR